MRCILLNPGPVSLSDSVRKAAVSSDISHREPEFRILQRRLSQGLLDVYGCAAKDWAVALLGGSGTTAVEAMVSSLLAEDARLLVVENGGYAARIGQIARIHGITTGSVDHGGLDGIDFDRVDAVLASGSFTHVAAVQHETGTGRLNDVRRLSALCERHGVQLLLDTVSAFGAEDVPVDSPALTACAGTAAQCLHGMPGLSFVFVRREAAARSVEPPRSLGLHLPMWLDGDQETGTPFTPPVNAMLALEQALSELRKSGGWKKRRDHYRELSGQVRQCLAEFGVVPLLEEDEASAALGAYRVPEGFDYERIHDGLKRWGFVISAGQGSSQNGVFRISVMGDITRYDIERLMAAIETVFRN